MVEPVVKTSSIKKQTFAVQFIGALKSIFDIALSAFKV
jgi:hypothetical protein